MYSPVLCMTDTRVCQSCHPSSFPNGVASVCNRFVLCSVRFSFQGSYWTIDTCPDISRKRRHPPDDDVSPSSPGDASQPSPLLYVQCFPRLAWVPVEVHPGLLGVCSASTCDPQLSQDSPEQEASKSPRGGIPGTGEASLPPEGNPQMSLQSPTSIASYSQVGCSGGRRHGASWLDGLTEQVQGCVCVCVYRYL